VLLLLVSIANSVACPHKHYKENKRKGNIEKQKKISLKFTYTTYKIFKYFADDRQVSN
jgi:hypothetical protein